MGIWSVWTYLAMRVKSPQVCCANNTCQEGMSKVSRPCSLPDNGFVALSTKIQPLLPCYLPSLRVLEMCPCEQVFAAGAGCIGIQNTEDGTCTPLPPWCRRSGPRKTIYLDPPKVQSCSLLASTLQCLLSMHKSMHLTMPV